MASSFRKIIVYGYYVTMHVLRQPIYLLRNCEVSWSSRIERGAILVNSTIGAYTYLAAGIYLNMTKIGNYCSIAAGSKIGGMEHSWWWGSTSTRLSDQNASEKETIIEDDVWIASNVVVRQGLRIGRGAVIGAGSVVLKDVAPYAIIAGVPAKEIRKRFNQEIIQQVLATRFWDYPPEKAKALLEAINYPDISCLSKPDPPK